MRRHPVGRLSWFVLISVSLVTLGGVLAPAAHGRELSPGCAELNDPKYDGYYVQNWINSIDFAFNPYERIIVVAGPPDDLGPNAGFVYLGEESTPYPASLQYVTTPQDAEQISWGIGWGTTGISGFNATWEVACEALPAGRISGQIHEGPIPPLPLGLGWNPLGEVYDEDGNLVDKFSTSNGRDYTTDWLEAGRYYVLMWSGDDDAFIDFFPEWYPDTPLLSLGPSNLITVEDDVSGIDATLELGYLDMWDSVFFEDIYWMQATSITRGCGDWMYCPDGLVTRGQMAAFLVRALGLTDDGGGDLFDDDDDSIFEADIDRLATAGITKGCNPPQNTRFCPDDRVTRGQMAAFLVRAMGYTSNGGGDLFEDDDDSVFEDDIDRLAAAGVTKGCNPPDNTRYCPEDRVTRGQMAAFLHRALGGILYPADADTHDPTTRSFTKAN